MLIISWVNSHKYGAAVENEERHILIKAIEIRDTPNGHILC